MTTSNDRLSEREDRHVIRLAERWTMTPMAGDAPPRRAETGSTSAFGGLLGLLPVRDVALFAHR